MRSQSDLPRFSYAVQGSASELVRGGGPQFDAFAAKVRTDLEAVFRNYQIDDHATLRLLLSARLNLEELAGDYAAALQTVDQIRSLQDTRAAMVVRGVAPRALVGAAGAPHARQGDAFTAALMRRYAQELEPLPWETVQDAIKRSHVGARIFTESVALADVMTELDPATQTSGALDAQEAWSLIDTRVDLVWLVPTGPARAKVLEDYIAAHRGAAKDYLGRARGHLDRGPETDPGRGGDLGQRHRPGRLPGPSARRFPCDGQRRPWAGL